VRHFLGHFHFLQCSYYCRKARARSTAERVLTAPSRSFLRVSWARVRPASTLLTLGKRIKVGQGQIRWIQCVLDDLELPGCYPVGRHDKGVQCMAEFSQWNHQSLLAIGGLFWLKTLRNLARASMMYILGVEYSPMGKWLV
jgi:hypothetical protein